MVFCSISATTIWSLKALAQRVLKLLSGNGFNSLGHCDLDLWPIAPKSIGFFYLIRAITLWRMNALGQRVLELFSGNGFHSLGHCDLDLWPTDPKINRGLLLNKGYHPMKFEGSGSKGIERKRSVTDGQADRRTRQKQYVSPRGGRHNWWLLYCSYFFILFHTIAHEFLRRLNWKSNLSEL